MKEAIEHNYLKTIYNQASRRYDFYHALVTLKSDERGRKMVVQNSVEPGNRVLDAGSGTGSTALLAAERVGSEGKVILLDMRDGMLEIAKSKLEAVNMGDRIELKTGDILQLPFEDNSFDVVLSTYSTCPLYSPEKGALELYRVVKPGGKLGIAHSTEPKNSILRWIANKIENFLWRFPQLTLGCRAITILPALKCVGTRVLLEKSIGFPLWPFAVFIVQKPE